MVTSAPDPRALHAMSHANTCAHAAAGPTQVLSDQGARAAYNARLETALADEDDDYTGQPLSKWMPAVKASMAKNEDPEESRAVFVVRPAARGVLARVPGHAGVGRGHAGVRAARCSGTNEPARDSSSSGGRSGGGT